VSSSRVGRGIREDFPVAESPLSTTDGAEVLGTEADFVAVSLSLVCEEEEEEEEGCCVGVTEALPFFSLNFSCLFAFFFLSA